MLVWDWMIKYLMFENSIYDSITCLFLILQMFVGDWTLKELMFENTIFDFVICSG